MPVDAHVVLGGRGEFIFMTFPSSSCACSEKLAAADCIVFANPEYNYRSAFWWRR